LKKKTEKGHRFVNEGKGDVCGGGTVKGQTGQVTHNNPVRSCDTKGSVGTAKKRDD